MKAIGYHRPLPLENPESLLSLEVPEPEAGPNDLVVDVHAVSVNPVDYKVRKSRPGSPTHPVVLGWDAAGTVRFVGSAVKDFTAGDRVYYAGDLNRAGSNAERQAVDARLVAKMPKKLSFAEAAALPLTSLTAYEGLFEKLKVPKDSVTDVLVIGGAGGVGSIAVQLLKTLTTARVWATAGRPESRAWLENLGIAGIVGRAKPLSEETKIVGAEGYDSVFVTTQTAQYLPELPKVVKPFGSIVLIDEPGPFDFAPFKPKSIGIHWELMFTKSLFGYRMESQGAILKEVAALVDQGKVKTTAGTVLKGFTVENFRKAHATLEAGTAVGKIVIER